MANNIWSDPVDRIYEYGIDRGVLYIGDVGYAWNGLTKVDESPDGGDIGEVFRDGRKYAMLASREELGGTISAFSYPPEFEWALGFIKRGWGLQLAEQNKGMFSMSYRTMIGNAVNPKFGYKLHILYGCMVSSSTVANATVNESASLVEYSWGLKTLQQNFQGIDTFGVLQQLTTAHIMINTTLTHSATGIAEIEKILYGEGSVGPRLITFEELMKWLQTMTPPAPYRVTPNSNTIAIPQVPNITYWGRIGDTADWFQLTDFITILAFPAGMLYNIEARIPPDFTMEPGVPTSWSFGYI